MKKVNEKQLLFVMLIWVSMVSAQNPSKVFSFETTILNKDLVTLQLQNADSTSVEYWKYAHVGFKVEVQVSPDRVKFLDDIEEHYTPTINSSGRTMTIKFDRLDDIVTINRRYWKDKVTITVFLPEKTSKNIVLLDKKTGNELAQTPNEPVPDIPPDYRAVRRVAMLPKK